MKLASPLYSLKAWQSLSSDAISKMYGVEGSGVFRRERNYTQLCKHYVTFNPQTVSQQQNRSVFASAVQSWQALPDESKQWWKHEQMYHRKYPVMDGYNLYIRKFMLGKEHHHGLP